MFCFTISGCPVPKGQASRRSRKKAQELWDRWVIYRDGACYEIRKQLEPLPWRASILGDFHQLGHMDPLPGPVLVSVQWWTPDATERDWDNAQKAIGDLLTHVGLLVRDDVTVIPVWVPHWSGMDRENPRVEVQVIELDRTDYPLPELKKPRKGKKHA